MVEYFPNELLKSLRFLMEIRFLVRTSLYSLSLGVYLKDLIYISEGNPDYLNGGMINLGKRRLLYAVLHQIRRFQVKSYNFEPVCRFDVACLI